jgi:hypothetical protein
MSGAGSSQTNHHTTSKPLSTFEFTKRKRWADILITGLPDVIILILSPEGKVLYCGTAVTELLGWNETDILDLHLSDFIIGEIYFGISPGGTVLLKQNAAKDQAVFQRGFEDAIRTNTELNCYIRLKSNPSMKPGLSPSNDVLFEIKGHPHFVTEQGPDCKCFFATAKPYPSRNIGMYV